MAITDCINSYQIDSGNCSMNYLAHAYLSFGDSDILAGNMISDFVKGKKKFDYPRQIQKGIMLHRTIDNFTDTHPATKAAIQILKPAVGSYAGAFADVVYDHFLANDSKQFGQTGLEGFAADTYDILQSKVILLPEKFKNMLPLMISQNWLLNYQTYTGIENSFKAIFRRAKYIEYTPKAFDCFKTNYEALNDCYQVFFPQVKQMAFSKFKLLVIR